MEWGVIKEFEGVRDDSVAGSAGRKRGIRVNVLCPGNIMTPVSETDLLQCGADYEFPRW